VLYPELSYALQGAFYEVYNVLGPGFREETYRQALMRELRLRASKLRVGYLVNFGAARLQIERRIV